MVDSQHVSSLCIQIMFGKLSSYYSTTRNVAATIVIAYPYLPPCLPPIGDELRSYFARTLISLSDTALLASQSQLLLHFPSLGADFLYRPVILLTNVDRWEGFSRYGRTPSLFVPVRGGGRVVMEVHLGWAEVLSLFDVHNRRSWTRFKGIPFDEKGQKNVELRGSDVSDFPLTFLTSFLKT